MSDIRRYHNQLEIATTGIAFTGLTSTYVSIYYDDDSQFVRRQERGFDILEETILAGLEDVGFTALHSGVYRVCWTGTIKATDVDSIVNVRLVHIARDGTTETPLASSVRSVNVNENPECIAIDKYVTLEFGESIKAEISVDDDDNDITVFAALFNIQGVCPTEDH